MDLPFHPPQRVTQPIISIGIFWIHQNGKRIIFRGASIIRHAETDRAQIVIIRRGGAIHSNRPHYQLDGTIALSFLMGYQPKQVQPIGVIWRQG